MKAFSKKIFGIAFFIDMYESIATFELQQKVERMNIIMYNRFVVYGMLLYGRSNIKKKEGFYV
ncbi:hypothetical protein AF2641_11600 [Anoxybacillus flavithermus]|nr:hypothetical protein AF2641_11600 [Anoxybacillus flavithermus]